MTRAAALSKVRKLLQLSTSSNAHEAAAALRHAQALMQAHAIDESEADGAEPIAEVEQANRGATPPIYAVELAHTVCDAFGVQSLLASRPSRRRARSVLLFVGPRSRAEISAYAYLVLLRQCERDRRHHLRRVRVTKNRAARGDLFGLGWVQAVRSTLRAFAGAHDDQARIAAYLARHHGNCQTREIAVRTSKAVVPADAAAGVRAGRRAQLHRGMASDAKDPVRLERLS